METNTIPGIITQAQFDEYAANWLATAADPGQLRQCFLAPGGKGPLQTARFGIQQVVQLVSAVGVQCVKARFLVRKDAAGAPRFTVALVATDGADKLLSAYYVAAEEPAAAAQDGYSGGYAAGADFVGAAPAAGQPPLHATQIPHGLVKIWVENWLNAAQATPAMFATPYGGAAGPLRGYTFEVSDFRNPIYNAQPIGQQEVCLGFALHEFYSPAPTAGALTQTFGLVVRLYNPTKADAVTSDDPFFDMGKPNPPG